MVGGPFGNLGFRIERNRLIVHPASAIPKYFKLQISARQAKRRLQRIILSLKYIDHGIALSFRPAGCRAGGNRGAGQMKIHVIGGGPAGLYFSILMKKAWPATRITMFERNRADD